MLEKLPEVIGQALHGVRAGLDEIAFNSLGLREGHGTLRVTSLAFADHAPIPPRYTADGDGLSPPVEWTGVPSNARGLVLFVEDADSPTPHPLVHAIVLELPAGDGSLGEGAMPSPDHEREGLRMGRNSYLQAAWLPPDPPPGHGVHRYAFQVYALDEAIDWSDTPGRDELLDVLRNRTLASGLLIGTCERADGRIKLDEGAPAGPVIAG